MRELTDKPFGVNIAQAFVRDPSIADFVVEQGVKFVTTSAGSPTKYTAPLKAAGLTVFHVVPNLTGALKAVDAEIGRASCRERVWQYVWISAVAVSFKNQNKKRT